MATPGQIRLVDSRTRQPILLGGVLLTRLEDHKVGMGPGSLFAVTESNRPFPIFRLTPTGQYEPDEGVLVTDVQMPIYSKRSD